MSYRNRSPASPSNRNSPHRSSRPETVFRLNPSAGSTEPGGGYEDLTNESLKTRARVGRGSRWFGGPSVPAQLGGFGDQGIPADRKTGGRQSDWRQAPGYRRL